MTKGVQYLPTYRSSYTGKSEDIGGSSPYHIDLKILASLPFSEKIRALDSLARQYAKNARVIEFSNQAVSGRQWNPDATPEEKKALYEAAVAAHQTRPGWDPLDFYVPFKGKSRFDQGAVEGASIYIPGVPGGKITRGQGGGYGYFSEALDPSGRVVFRVGHGDINRPEQETEIQVQGQLPVDAQTAPTLPPADSATTAEDLLAAKLEEMLNPEPPIGNEYTGPSEEYFQKNAEAIDKLAQLLMKEKAETSEPQRLPAYVPNQVAQLMAAQAQQAFKSPKSFI